MNTNEVKVNTDIGRVRARPFRPLDDYITLQHGSGGRAPAALIRQAFFDAYGNEAPGQGGGSRLFAADAVAEVAVASIYDGVQPAMSTDSYVINPVEFPGGNIGDLAVNGTINGLAVAGVRPPASTVSLILGEGLGAVILRRIMTNMRTAADAVGVNIVTDDAKAMPKGTGDRVYITTVGVGVVHGDYVGTATKGSVYVNIEAGNRILVSGPVADHGTAVMPAHGDSTLATPIESDTRTVNGLVEALLEAVLGARRMYDAARGDFGTAASELAHGTGLGVVLDDESVAVREVTHGACDMLGIDSLYVANEDTFIAVVPVEQSEAALSALHTAGVSETRDIGSTKNEPVTSVVLVTGSGGTRMVDMLVGDSLPRICQKSMPVAVSKRPATVWLELKSPLPDGTI